MSMERKNPKKKNYNVPLIVIFLLIIIIVLLLVVIFKIRVTTDLNYNSLTEIIEVSSENENWVHETKLNIFNNEQYNYDKMIAPGSAGTYNFVIRGMNDAINFKYKIEFEDSFSEKINMKFRLKQDGKYLEKNGEEWVDLSQINVYDLPLNGLDEHYYTLEWKWIDSEDDTQSGINGDYYTLLININMEQVL